MYVCMYVCMYVLRHKEVKKPSGKKNNDVRNITNIAILKTLDQRWQG